MENMNHVYLLDGHPVNRQLWSDTLNECIATVQTKTSCCETKRAIRKAILTDIQYGKTSVVNGRQFAELACEVNT